MKKHRQGTKPQEVLSLVDIYIIANRWSKSIEAEDKSKYEQKYGKNSRKN